MAALGLAAVAAGCSTVSPDELDTSLSTLREEMRQEMRTGDETVSQQLGGRITTVEGRVAALDSDLEQMAQDFEVAIQRLEEELRFDVPVYFAFDDATVEAEDQAVLDRFGAVALKYYPNATITVEGFTDSAGPEAYNTSLGQRRADAVREYLVGNAGMVQEQVRAVSYGEDTQRLVQPEGRGPGMAGWENRRVVLVIDHDGTPPMPTVTDGDQDSDS
jgi:peptidoglycan-associated lipoprotein